MKRLFIKFVALNLLFSLLFAIGCKTRTLETSIEKEKIGEFIIAGSGSNLPITSRLVEQYNQLEGKDAKVPKSIGSSGAIKAASEGVISLGLISRPLKQEELNQGLKQIPYARVGIIIGTNSDVLDNNITSQDLVDIFWGKKNRWQNGQMIIVLSREKGDSTNKVLEDLIPGFKNALHDSLKKKRWQVYYTDLEESEAIVNTPSSIGFTDTGALTALNLRIKPLQVNGIEPTIANLKNGSYPLYKDLFFVYKESASEETTKFLDFVRSDEGQRIISANGGIPLKGN